MSVYLTGDYHGGIESHKVHPASWPEGQTLDKDDYLLIAGDFGLGWAETPSRRAKLEWLDSMPWTTLFVDGNHENFDVLDALPTEPWMGGETSPLPGTGVRWLRRGQVFDICGARIFTMGGATSTDRDQRIENVSWWARELPSDVEYAEATKNLDASGWRVDFVITHTCPTSLLAKSAYPHVGWDRFRSDKLTDFLDDVNRRLCFRCWYYGHFHQDRDVDDSHSVVYNRIVRIAG